MERFHPNDNLDTAYIKNLNMIDMQYLENHDSEIEIKIHVVMGGGGSSGWDTITFKTDPGYCPRLLMSYLADQTSIPINNQLLTFNWLVLNEDSESFHRYGIGNGSELKLEKQF